MIWICWLLGYRKRYDRMFSKFHGIKIPSRKRDILIMSVADADCRRYEVHIDVTDLPVEELAERLNRANKAVLKGIVNGGVCLGDMLIEEVVEDAQEKG